MRRAARQAAATPDGRLRLSAARRAATPSSLPPPHPISAPRSPRGRLRYEPLVIAARFFRLRQIRRARAHYPPRPCFWAASYVLKTFCYPPCPLSSCEFKLWIECLCLTILTLRPQSLAFVGIRVPMSIPISKLAVYITTLLLYWIQAASEQYSRYLYEYKLLLSALQCYGGELFYF